MTGLEVVKILCIQIFVPASYCYLLLFSLSHPLPLFFSLFYSTFSFSSHHFSRWFLSSHPVLFIFVVSFIRGAPLLLFDNRCLIVFSSVFYFFYYSFPLSPSLILASVISVPLCFPTISYTHAPCKLVSGRRIPLYSQGTSSLAEFAKYE